ncbi:MAG: hypothetical protein AAFZ46_12280 [Pseudomonadota bacterium]
MEHSAALKAFRAVLKAFRAVEQDVRTRHNAVINIKPDRPATVGKHEARNYVHLSAVLKEADEACPRAADTIRWLLWHEIVDAQWAMYMVEMIESGHDTEEQG